jgi:hypothetical protein
MRSDGIHGKHESQCIAEQHLRGPQKAHGIQDSSTRLFDAEGLGHR